MTTRSTRTSRSRWPNSLATWLLPLVLIWTNPSTNSDGSPLTDLAAIRVAGRREVNPIVMVMDLPIWSIDDDGTPYARSVPGGDDSTFVTIPLRRRATDWWVWEVSAVDSVGNVSVPSDTVRVNLVSPGPVTGIGDLPSTASTAVEWYDAQGRRIQRPKSSGLYFRRVGARVDKVILVK